jgi:ABC-type Na+ efflux pump, permease component
MGKNKIGIIIGREFSIRVKKKSFILTTILTPLLFAGLMIVPGLIAMYSGDDENLKIKVVDESGIVMPYLENSETLTFEPVNDKTITELKDNFKEEDAYAILGISKLDSAKNVKVIAYSEKQINIDIQSQIKKNIRKAIENNKLSGYNIPELDKILKDIKSDINMNLYTLDEATGEETESKVEIIMAIGYIASSLIYMFIFMFGSMVMRSVIEEKTTRIVEVIVSSVKPFQLMMGKILGVASVALTQFFIWIVLTVLIVVGVGTAFGDKVVNEKVSGQIENIQDMSQMQSTGNSNKINAQLQETLGEPQQTIAEAEAESTLNAEKLEKSENIMTEITNSLKQINFVEIILCFVIYFVLGYLLYASMFAAVGSAVDNEADTQQLILPVTIPLIIGLFIMLHTFQYPDSSLSFWGSIIPFTSPMVMMARIAYGVPGWQLALSIGLLIITFIIFAYLSGKIYRIGILMYGKKANLKDLYKWLRR